jgi:hypothetical protein
MRQDSVQFVSCRYLPEGRWCARTHAAPSDSANLADDFKPGLLLGFRFTLRRGRELQHRCNPIVGQEVQQHLFAIGEFDRIVMTQWLVLVDLPEDCGAVLAYPVSPYIFETIEFHIPMESQLRSRQYTHTTTAASSWQAKPRVPHA